MKSLMLALKLSRRQWRYRELKMVAIALWLAVTVFTSVSLVTEQVKHDMLSEASQLLGADLLLVSSTPIQKNIFQQARKYNLESTATLQFLSMIRTSKHLQLSSIKAIDKGYPLRGKITLQNKQTESIPPPHALWVAPQLLSLLNVKIGDRVKIGEAPFTIDGILLDEPLQQTNFFNFSPKVLMNQEDIAATHIIQAGSRVTYHALFSGDPKAIQAMQQWLQQHREPGQNITAPKENRPSIQKVFQRAQLFYQITATLVLFLAGIAIFIALQRYFRRSLDLIALLRCLGAKRQALTAIYGIQFLFIAMPALFLGCITGYVLQLLISSVYYQRFIFIPSTYHAFWLGLLTGVLLLIGAALPSLWQLQQVAPLRLIKRDMPLLPPNTWFFSIVAIVILFLLLRLQIDSTRLTVIFLGGFLVTMGVLTSIASLCFRGLQGLRTYVSPAYRYGLSNLIRDPIYSKIQLFALSLCILLTVLLLILRYGFIDNWLAQLSPTTPNYFAINIESNQVNPLKNWLKKNNIITQPVYPMVRGRLTTLNGKNILEAIPKEALNNNALYRALNLTWAQQLPDDNEIVQGHWWKSTEHGEHLISIEEKLATKLHLKIGDELGFRLGDKRITAKIASLRSVNWSSFHPNFYVIFPPGVLNTFSATHITSFYIPPEAKTTRVLIDQFPNITLFDVTQILNQIKTLLNKLALSMAYIIFFCFATSLLILFAILQNSFDARAQELKIFHLLGAQRSFLEKSLLTEFGLFGLLSGIIGAISAQMIAWSLGYLLLGIHLPFWPWLWLTPFLSTMMVALIGKYRGLKDAY